MQDIPFFHTEKGVASLRLKEIPYFQTAYITMQSTLNEEEFLQECVSFCRAAGAESIYAIGLAKEYGNSVDVVKMTRNVDVQADAGALLFPVQEETVPYWREIYNQKMRNVTGAAYMSDALAKTILADRKGYFIHRNGELIGIGTASGDEISAVVSVQKGAGKYVVNALLGALSEDTAVIEVASDNKKAMDLYSSLGFVTTDVVARWCKII